MVTLTVADTTGRDHTQDIHPGDLSDRARAALAQWTLGRPTDLTLISKTPLRDHFGPDGVTDQIKAFHTPAQLAAPVIQVWSGWSPWAGPTDSTHTTPLEYLEAELRKIPDGWWIDEPVPAGEAAAMAGMAAATWRACVSRGQAPTPDDPGDLTMPPRARRPRWQRTTIARWLATRPGQGARTDRNQHAHQPE